MTIPHGTVTGHDFSRANKTPQGHRALTPAEPISPQCKPFSQNPSFSSQINQRRGSNRNFNCPPRHRVERILDSLRWLRSVGCAAALALAGVLALATLVAGRAAAG